MAAQCLSARGEKVTVVSPLVKADAQITHERALADLKAILYAAQHSRSVMAEYGWTDDVAKQVLATLEPWLWDEERVIVLPLAKLIQRCEARGGKVAPIDYYNFLIIAEKTPSIGAGVLIMFERELPEPDISRILPALRDGADCE